MLSYRHGFHAGNHADVLKHFVCVAIAEYLQKKESPYCYIDTHSGAGAYSLHGSLANKTQEYKNGIGRLYKHANMPELATYLDLIGQINQDAKLDLYPGSPLFMTTMLREQDQAHLFEMHPQDYATLEKNNQGNSAVKTYKQDGFAGLKALLPPKAKRGFVIIDPPYEQAQEYKNVQQAIEQSLKRFAIGVYAVWYPLINRNDKQGLSEKMVEGLKKLNHTKYLDVRFWVSENTEGMYGSGLFIVNPPYVLEQQLKKVLPFLVETLGLDETAGYSLNYIEK